MRGSIADVGSLLAHCFDPFFSRFSRLVARHIARMISTESSYLKGGRKEV
jgi:hypothetical protein